MNSIRIINDSWEIANAIFKLADTKWKTKKYNQAIDLYNESLAMSREFGYTKSQFQILTNLKQIADELETKKIV